MIKIDGKKVIVVGTGKSGIGSAVLLEKNGALPVIYDGNDKAEIDAVKEQLTQKLGFLTKAEVVTGEFPKHITNDAALCVLSPGVPVDADFVVYMKEQGIPIWGEVELAYNFANGACDYRNKRKNDDDFSCRADYAGVFRTCICCR